MKEINFSDYAEKIKEALEKRVLSLPDGEEGFTLVDGFFPHLNNPHLRLNGDNAVICVAIISNISGLVHFFSLKSLLPEIEIKEIERK